MRIIAGQWRGRKIVAPPGDATRPTSDRVREALFSMLASRLGTFDDLRIADFFAGSGALGLEALSRGAAHCTFVERDRAAVTALKANIATLDAPADVQNRAAEVSGQALAAYDVILMDPPYHGNLVARILSDLSAKGWIAPRTWISVETERGATIDVPGMTVDAVKRFGKAQITLLRPSEA